MDNTIFAYLAGVLDSDGSIFIARRSPGKARRVSVQHILTLAVTQIHREAISVFEEAFGGHCSQHQPQALKGRTWVHKRPLWVWTTYSGQAETCLKQLEPYLRIKKTQAQIALAFRSTYHRKYHRLSISPDILQQREELWQRMRNLNSVEGKGHHRPQKIKLFV